MTVTKFESDLIRLTRFLVGNTHEPANAILHRQTTAPQGLSPNAVTLIEDTLRKGLIRFLASGGGWKTRRFLKNDQPQGGHPWRRHTPEELQLRFSAQVLSFLIWLTAERPSEARQAWKATAPLTLADHLFFLRAAEALQAYPEQWSVLARSTPFAANPLLWIAMPRFVESDDAPDFHALFQPPGPAILECLQDWLAEQWQSADANCLHLIKLEQDNERETAAISSFLRHAEQARRQDLALFLLQAVKQRSKVRRDFQAMFSSVPRLEDRQRLARLSLSLFTSLDVFERWQRQARGTGYFDDGYQPAQFWLSEFEAHDGPRLVQHYRELLASIDPLSTRPA